MEWKEALEIEIARNKHERWRALCDDSHPDHAAHRRRVVDLATGKEFPSLATEAANAAKAIGRVVSAIALGEPVSCSDEEQARRLAICQGCEQYLDGRCLICGCVAAWKTRMMTEHCPLTEPKR
jgi:hypothetical protein